MLFFFAKGLPIKLERTAITSVRKFLILHDDNIRQIKKTAIVHARDVSAVSNDIMSLSQFRELHLT